MAELLTLVEVNHADTPRLLLGHSMGGLIACLFLVERQQAFVAAAVSGPAILPAEPPSRFTGWISRLLSPFFPPPGVTPWDANGVRRPAQGGPASPAGPRAVGGKNGTRQRGTA